MNASKGRVVLYTPPSAVFVDGCEVEEFPAIITAVETTADRVTLYPFAPMMADNDEEKDLKMPWLLRHVEKADGDRPQAGRWRWPPRSP